MTLDNATTLGHIRLLQQVLDLLPQYIFWKDRQSTFLGCNLAFANLNGFEKTSDLVGKNDFDLPCKPEEAEFFRECDRRVMESNIPEYHIVEPLLDADGIQKWLDTTKVPLLDENGTVVGILGTFEDITERVQAEIALKETSAHFQALAQERAAEIEVLKRIVPICSFCKQIRDESGEWRPIESYLKETTQDDFSHTYCDKCMAEHFGEF